jgi:hypothetical protein
MIPEMSTGQLQSDLQQFTALYLKLFPGTGLPATVPGVALPQNSIKTAARESKETLRRREAMIMSKWLGNNFLKYIHL